MQQIKTLIFMESLLILSFILFIFAIPKRRAVVINPKTIFIIVMIPFFGLFGYNKNVFYGFLFLSMFIFTDKSDNFAGVYLLLLTLFPAMNGDYKIGTTYFGMFSAIDALNVGAFVACFFIKRTNKTILSLNIAVFLIFIIYAATSGRDLNLTGFLRSIVDSFMIVVPPYYVLSKTLRTRTDVENVGLFLVLGAICNATVAIFESIKGWALYESFNQQLQIENGRESAQLAVRAGFLRGQGAVANAATLGLLMGLGIFGCLAMKKRMDRTWYYALLAILLVAMVSSQSRGAWIATAVGLIYFWWSRKQTLRAVVLGAGAMLTWLASKELLPQTSTIGQLIGQSGHASGSAAYRINLLWRGIEEVRAHPIFGQSRDQLEFSMNDLRQGEGIIDFVNTPLYVALTLGVIGLVTWIIAWFIPIIVAQRSRRPMKKGSMANAPIEFPCAILVAVFVSLIFTSPIDRMLPLATISIGMLGSFIIVNRSSMRL